AHGVDFVENLEQAFARLHAELGPPQLVLGVDCVHRKLETLQHGFSDRVEEIFQRNDTIGFRTYGEQYHGVHVNATLTGIAIGKGSSDEPDS
ncbi:MAG: FIST domain containing protein, partial [Deltaproteobacteria bacterium]|nr:FIST domain containing protein [Deltaproteobacteria bacterium]